MIKGVKGFSLIELLVVIAIIAVISTIGAMIYSGFQVSARDAKRKVDIEAIASALEANYGQAGGNHYITLTPQMFTSGSIPTDPLSTDVAPDDSCPGVCKYCVFEGTSPQPKKACSLADIKVVSATEPAGGLINQHWTICANLEKGGFYCKSSGR